MEFTMKLRKLSRPKNYRSCTPRAKQVKRTSTIKIKRCVCLPRNYAAVEFSPIWTELRHKAQLCDGIIHCEDGRDVKLHRVILSAVSPYFRALFTNSINRNQRETSEAFVNIPSKILELFLDYAYTGQCIINAENVQRLLSYADQFEVLGLVQLCCEYILSNLRPDNCIGILRFARHYFCRNLEERGRKFLIYQFKDIAETSIEFLQLTAEELKDILADDELNVKNEGIVFQSIKRWVEYDMYNRKPFIMNLLGCVRFGLMSYTYFTSNVLKWSCVQNEQSCQDALLPASAFLTEMNEREVSETDLTDPLARPRVPYEILFAMGGWSAGSPTSFVETYDTRADRWLLSSNTDIIPRAYHDVCTLDGLIYLIGGFDGNEHFNTVRTYNPVTHEWGNKACLFYQRCYVSVVALDGKIYAMGGYNGRMRMSSVERYDPKKNQWDLIAPMQRQRSDASAAALKNKIYIVGGFNGSEVLNSAEMYDPIQNLWTFIPTMLNARSGVSLVAHKDSLYALGGFNGFTRLASGEKYNPGTQADWKEITDMFNPRSNFATAVLDDMIFVIGGFNGATTISFVECYDANSNEWYDAAPMNLNRSALSACVMSSLPNAREFSYLGKQINGDPIGLPDCDALPN